MSEEMSEEVRKEMRKIRKGLGTIKRVALASRTQSHRLRWIVAKCESLLTGNPIPPGRLPCQRISPRAQEEINHLKGKVELLKIKLELTESEGYFKETLSKYLKEKYVGRAITQELLQDLYNDMILSSVRNDFLCGNGSKQPKGIIQ